MQSPFVLLNRPGILILRASWRRDRFPDGGESRGSGGNHPAGVELVVAEEQNPVVHGNCFRRFILKNALGFPAGALYFRLPLHELPGFKCS